MAQAETFTGAHGTFDAGVVDSQVSSLTQLFDIRNGGFGRAPKFPHCSSLDLILECYQQAVPSGADSAKHLLAMAETTLVKMSRGGTPLTSNAPMLRIIGASQSFFSSA